MRRIHVFTEEVTTMTNYNAFREFDTGLTQADLDEAVARSIDAIEDMRGEGTSITYLGSDVFTDDDGSIKATVCRYDAESRAKVEEHSNRSELPFRQVLRREKPLDGVSPRVA